MKTGKEKKKTAPLIIRVQLALFDWFSSIIS
jgi:hypothetical protein